MNKKTLTSVVAQFNGSARYSGNEKTMYIYFHTLYDQLSFKLRVSLTQYPFKAKIKEFLPDMSNTLTSLNKQLSRAKYDLNKLSLKPDQFADQIKVIRLLETTINELSKE